MLAGDPSPRHHRHYSPRPFQGWTQGRWLRLPQVSMSQPCSSGVPRGTVWRSDNHSSQFSRTHPKARRLDS